MNRNAILHDQSCLFIPDAGRGCTTCEMPKNDAVNACSNVFPEVPRQPAFFFLIFIRIIRDEGRDSW